MSDDTADFADLACTWTEDDDGNWSTDCGEMFTLIDATPQDNGMIYCCYCGDVLRQVRATTTEEA